MNIQTIAKSLSLVLFGCIAACSSAASSKWDAKSAASLRAQPEGLLRDLDAGNFRAMLAEVDDDAIVLDLDENNKPVRFQGKEAVSGYFKGLEEAAKSQGLKFDSKIVRNDCAATSSVGYCVLEFDQTISAGGKAMPPARYRATLVSRKVGDTWRWTHWHGSLSSAPMPPAAVSAAVSAK